LRGIGGGRAVREVWFDVRKHPVIRLVAWAPFAQDEKCPSGDSWNPAPHYGGNFLWQRILHNYYKAFPEVLLLSYAGRWQKRAKK